MTDDAVNPQPVPDPEPGAGAAAAAAPEAPTPPSAPTAGTRIVVAEDEALIRLDLAEMLGEEGYEVVGQAATASRRSSWPRSCAPTWSSWTSRCPSSTASRRRADRAASGSPRSSCSPRSRQKRARRAGPRRRRDGLRRQAVHRHRPRAGHRHRPLPVAELHALETEIADLGERLETRKAVDRAKGVLMAQLRSARRTRSGGSRRRRWTGASVCVRSPRRSSRACRPEHAPPD